MKLYLPYYDGEKRCLEFDPAQVLTYGHGTRIVKNGRIYNAEKVYTDPEGVRLAWAREHGRAEMYRVCLVP